MSSRFFKNIVTTFVVLLSIAGTALAKDKLTTNGNGDPYTAIMSTKFDFGETGINGEMKAPDGFFLQGKQSQSLSQMVRLRSSFKKELRTSRAGVKSLTR